MRVIDLGAGENPDPRATETVDLYTDADHTFDLRERWPLADASTQGLIATHVIEHLPDPQHFFTEAARVLHHQGWLEVTYPIGADRFTDPTHEQYWTPGTAYRFSDTHNEPWDPTTGFHLTNHDIDAWYYPPLHVLNPLVEKAAGVWPGRVAEHADAGEVTARYEKQ